MTTISESKDHIHVQPLQQPGGVSQATDKEVLDALYSVIDDWEDGRMRIVHIGDISHHFNTLRELKAFIAGYELRIESE